MDRSEVSGYRWRDAELTCAHDYLLPGIMEELSRLREACSKNGGARVFEVGCGNGSVAHALAQSGWSVIGVDPSVEGIAQANARYPNLSLHDGSAYDDLAGTYGQFQVVMSLEVVEHVYFPRK
ncbi:MAG: methyltransferase domain-containing protein [Planctomycetales bacterium]|nr:methyltransferase domain-containing protein [Planctomycetales bacterium]